MTFSTDTAHLDVLNLKLSNERQRLASARSDSERSLRTEWVKQLENEIAQERVHLGLPPEQDGADMSVDALLNELGF